jgi:hypothetical protein
MHTLLQQLPALLGVVVGALTTWAATSSAERARWHRDHAVRWDEKRLIAYTDYSRAVKSVISAATRLAELRADAETGTTPPIADETAALAAGEIVLAAAEDERTVTWESVLLLGSDDVITAARVWHQSAFRLARSALGRVSDMSWDEAIEVTGKARGAYYYAAKADLGIGISGGSDTYEWQMAKFTKADAEARGLPGK